MSSFHDQTSIPTVSEQQSSYELPDEIIRDNIFPFIEGIELICYFRLVCKNWQQLVRECPFSLNVGNKLGLELKTNEDFWNWCDEGLFCGMERADFREIGLGVMECFPYFENLKILRLEKCMLSDENSYYLSTLKSLKRLDVNKCLLESKVLYYISTIENLKELSLDRIPNSGPIQNNFGEFQYLSKLKYLSKLELKGCGYGLALEDVRILMDMKSLTFLNLDETTIGNIQAEYISNMRSLTFLGLTNTLVGGIVLEHFSKLENLNILHLEHDNIVSGFIAPLSRLNLEILNLGFNDIDVEGVEYISKIGTLKTLILNDNPIGSQGANYISKLVNLTELNLSNTGMDNRGIGKISHLPNLITLDIGYNMKLTKLGALYLSRMKSLRKLSIPQTGINDEGVEFIVNMENLKFLDVRGLPLTIRGLETIVDYKTKHESTIVLHIPIPPTIPMLPKFSIQSFQYRFDENIYYF